MPAFETSLKSPVVAERIPGYLDMRPSLARKVRTAFDEVSNAFAV
jgi:hypothetical protein